MKPFFFAMIFATATAFLLAGCVSQPSQDNSTTANASATPLPQLSDEESLQRLDSLSTKVFSTNDSFRFVRAVESINNGVPLRFNVSVDWAPSGFRLLKLGAEPYGVVYDAKLGFLCINEECGAAPQAQVRAAFSKTFLGSLGEMVSGKPSGAVTVKYLGDGRVLNRSCELYDVFVDGSRVESMRIDGNSFFATTTRACVDKEFGYVAFSKSLRYTAFLDERAVAQGQREIMAKMRVSISDAVVSFEKNPVNLIVFNSTALNENATPPISNSSTLNFSTLNSSVLNNYSNSSNTSISNSSA